ncbi:hypothetical protein MPLDJ20_220051 [Mesorhizobium plurifarium]|uniref:Uncharacterized protein n=1 Tax=Mesorhizobium plurifarium TaxID=69974 RepID=A0A090F964_MESPL|nr:hypothetical protein MPLDJ20_220051 [Mesorhizobium plurifarium]
MNEPRIAMHISLSGMFDLRSAALSDVLEELGTFIASFAVSTRNGQAGVPSNACRTEKLHRRDWNDGMPSPSTAPSIVFLERSNRCSGLIGNGVNLTLISSSP